MISFCIPWHSKEPHRINAFQHITEHLEQHFSHEEILWGGPVPFERALARNFLAKDAENEILAFLDADSFVTAQHLREAAYMAQARGWCLAYDTYYNLTEGATLDWLNGRPRLEYEFKFPSPEYNEPAVGGCVMVHRDAFEQVGGYDPRFLGWGEEDRAFVYALETLYPPEKRISGPLYHFWHPAPTEEVDGQPFFKQNQALCDRYRAARGNPEAMTRLVREFSP